MIAAPCPYESEEKETGMGKKVLILKGSPREKGNSAALSERVAAGAREAGWQVLSVTSNQ